MPNRSKSHHSQVTILSFLVMLGCWAGLAWLLSDPATLPGPAQVLTTALAEAANGQLLHHLGATLRRVTLGFVAAMLVGSITGIAMGSFPRFGQIAEPWVMFFLNLPALVVIVLCYLWLGLGETAAIIAVMVNKSAMIAITMREGIRILDPDIADMAKVYGMSPQQRLRHVTLPQLAPFIATGVRNGLSIIWKIVLVVEFLGRADGIGFQIHFYFQLFETSYVLAYALSFMLLMFAVEFLLIQPLEQKANKWRQPNQEQNNKTALQT